MKEQGIQLISKVLPESIGEELGIEEGDILLTINGKQMSDIIEYRFSITEEFLEVEIQKCDGEIWSLEIEKDYDEDLGLEFENPIIDQSKHCQNKCIFCFIDQLPENMRETLYFKDDDSRLSFLQGNYITLTNMTDEEIVRIIQYRISPLNLSVHSTNPQLRKEMLNNKRAGRIYELMKKFDRNEIRMNCQIVLCPKINDGIELDRTISDLSRLKNVVSTAIVPVGITKFREDLKNIEAYNGRLAVGVVNQVEKWQKKNMVEKGRKLVHLSDEFYLLAKIPIPSYDDYEGFPQIENGVGLIRKFNTEVERWIDERGKTTAKELENTKHLKIAVATGTLAEDFMKNLTEKIMQTLPTLQFEVVPVVNDFFGHNITVSGLVTGGDLIKTFRHKKKTLKSSSFIVVPRAMLKSEETLFLDDHSLESVSSALGIPIVPLEVNGAGFLEALIKEAKKANEVK